jgi:hypothetical protein
MMDFIAHADETNDLIDIGNVILVPVWESYEIVEKLKLAELLETVSEACDN